MSKADDASCYTELHILENAAHHLTCDPSVMKNTYKQIHPCRFIFLASNQATSDDPIYPLTLLPAIEQANLADAFNSFT